MHNRETHEERMGKGGNTKNEHDEHNEKPCKKNTKKNAWKRKREQNKRSQ